MVMPLGDDDTGLRRFGFVTLALIIVSVAVWLLTLAQPDIQAFFMQWSVIPAEYSQQTDLPPEIPFPFWVTVFTAMFMHGSWMHLIGNMLFLWIFGDNVENGMGHVKFLIFYLVCGIVATAAQILVGPGSEIPNLGASGAISGVLGAYLVMYPRQRVRVLVGRAITTMPAMAVIGLWIVFQFINGIGQIAQTEETGGVAYAAHIGGFVAGLALVWVFRNYGSRQRVARS